MSPESFELQHDAERQDGGVLAKENQSRTRTILTRISRYGVEIRGIEPVPMSEKTKDNYINMLAFWTSMLCNFLPVSTGMTASISFGMSLRDSSLVIIFFNLLSFAITAWASLMGVRLGFRQMIHARFAFGLYCNSIAIVFNLITILGFTMISAIISGQTLAAVNNGGLTVSLGIVLSGLIGLIISFMGYQVLHHYNKWSWIVMLICTIIATGCAGKDLHHQVQQPPTSAPTILTYGSLMFGFSITLFGLMSDFTVYYRPDAPGFRIFLYILIGQTLPTVLLMILGAAIGGAVPNIASWTQGYNNYSVGGVVTAMLSPAGGFGKFVAVLLAFSLIGNIAASMYSISLNFQMLFPPLVHVPRICFSIVTVAIIIPVGIEAAHNFFGALESFLGVISYWPGCFIAIIMVEHLIYRRNDPKSYDREAWRDARRLPSGIAAVAAALCSVALIVPCMSETWYTGPIAKHTGDIGFEVAFAVTACCYVCFRWVEIKVQGRL